MKRRIIFRLIITLALLSLLALPILAAAAADVPISIDAPTQVPAGSDFIATITIGNITDFDAAQYDITYNPNVIQVTAVTDGSIGGTAIPVGMWASINSNTIRVINNVPGVTGVTGSGYLAEIHFHVVGAAESSSNISLSNGLLGDKNAQPIPATWADATVKVSTSGTSGGGGGGGGGGGPSGVTSLIEYTTDDGTFVSDAHAESMDGKVKLDIPKGTIGKNKNDQRLYYVSIKENTTPPTPPGDSNFVCLTYDIGPAGATFDPPIYLTFKYSDSQVPAGVAEENLKLATWQDGKWVPFEDCIVDPINNTITVPLSHFSTFTVLAYTSPASFEASGLTISPTEVYPGDTVTVSATITNTGDLTGSFNVILKINNSELQTEKVTLVGGQSQVVRFAVIPDTTGEYTVEINGLSSKYKVKEPVPQGTVAEVTLPTPASFIISGLSITPDEVNPNEEVTISTLVTNIGGSQGSYLLVLKINNRQEAKKEVVLEGNQSQKVSFTTVATIGGNYSIEINGKAGQFNVIAPKPTLPKATDEIPYVRPTNWPLYIGVTAALGGTVIIGLSIFITLRRRRSYRINGR